MRYRIVKVDEDEEVENILENLDVEEVTEELGDLLREYPDCDFCVERELEDEESELDIDEEE